MEIELKYTGIFEQNNEAWLSGKRRALNEGGTRSSKTWSILQLLILIAQHAKSPLLISVVSESMPHLRKGAIRDFFKILGEQEKDNPRWNATHSIYTWGKGKIEFFGADEWGKISGLTREILFINEGDHVPWDTARGLDVRTSLFTFVDWNPTSEFWAHENWIGEPENEYIHSTYLDTVCDGVSLLPQKVFDNIESNKDKDPNWWSIYGLGLLGKIEGLVFPQIINESRQVDELPRGDVFYGLDYGFSSDPTVLVANVIVGDNLYSHQMFYDYSGMTNDDIARRMELMGVSREAPIYGDPNEPKSAEEIRQRGFNIQIADSGKGSVEHAIRMVNSLYQYWTKISTECIKEQRNFRFIMRREPNTGREYLSDDTTHQWSHGMRARGYGVASRRSSIGWQSTRSSFRF